MKKLKQGELIFPGVHELEHLWQFEIVMWCAMRELHNKHQNYVGMCSVKGSITEVYIYFGACTTEYNRMRKVT